MTELDALLNATGRMLDGMALDAKLRAEARERSTAAVLATIRNESEPSE